MEKQKIFWVVLSVTIFVVVVLVVGVFLLKRDPDGLASAPGAAAGAAGAAKPSTETPAGLYEFGRDAGTSAGDTEVLRFVIGGGEESPAAAGDGSAAAGSTTGSTAPGAGSAATSPTEPASASPGAAAPAASTAVATAKPAATSAAAKPSASKPAAAKPAATARGPEYWIQTGSYRSQSRAEELSQMLAARGLAGRVFSFAKSNETYFRVRIGPYGNRQEAEKFLAIVKKIQGLDASYISMVQANRSVN